MKLLALPLRPCRQCLYSVVCSVVGKIVPSPSLGYPLRHLLCWASYSDSTDIVARWPSSSLMSTRPKDDFSAKELGGFQLLGPNQDHQAGRESLVSVSFDGPGIPFLLERCVNVCWIWIRMLVMCQFEVWGEAWMVLIPGCLAPQRKVRSLAAWVCPAWWSWMAWPWITPATWFELAKVWWHAMSYRLSPGWIVAAGCPKAFHVGIAHGLFFGGGGFIYFPMCLMCAFVEIRWNWTNLQFQRWTIACCRMLLGERTNDLLKVKGVNQQKTSLGGGVIFLISPLFGEDSHFDYNFSSWVETTN